MEDRTNIDSQIHSCYTKFSLVLSHLRTFIRIYQEPQDLYLILLPAFEEFVRIFGQKSAEDQSNILHVSTPVDNLNRNVSAFSWLNKSINA